MQAEVFNTLGKSYYQERQFEAAITCYQKSLSVSQQFENRRGEIASLYNLGHAYLELREFSQATRLYHGDRYSQALTYHGLGTLAKANDLGLL